MVFGVQTFVKMTLNQGRRATLENGSNGETTHQFVRPCSVVTRHEQEPEEDSGEGPPSEMAGAQTVNASARYEAQSGIR